MSRILLLAGASAIRGFTTRWTVSGDDAARTITLPLAQSRAEGALAYNFTVNWGDGTYSTVTAYNDPNRIHTYANNGTYDVEIRGICEGWSFQYAAESRIKAVVTWGTRRGFGGFKFLSLAFWSCSQLGSIPQNESIPASGTGCLSQGLGAIFVGTAIQQVPDMLFFEHPLAGDMAYVFQGSALKSVPNGLFSRQLSAVTFASAFSNAIDLVMNPRVFCRESEENTRFLNQSVSFRNFLYRDFYVGASVGSAPDLWNYNFGTGTPNKTGAFSGAGNSPTSLSNYADIPAEWK